MNKPETALASSAIKSKICTAMLLSLSMLFSAASAVGSEHETESTAPERVIVAKVNGQPIYEDQLEPKVQSSLRKYSRLGVQESSDHQVRQLQLAVLDEVIATELFLQASQELDIPDIDTRLEDELAQEKAKPTFDPNRVSEEEMREHVRRRIYLIEYLDRNDLREPQVPEADIKAFYDQNKESFTTTADKAHIRHILLKFEKDATPQDKEQARKEIEALRQQLLDGADFEQIAKEHSQDANAANGGDLGHIEPGYMPPAFDAVAFSLESGKLSDVVETEYGFHVLEVLAKTPKGMVPSYENMRGFLGKYLQEETRQKNLKAHAQMLKERAEIEILVPTVQ